MRSRPLTQQAPGQYDRICKSEICMDSRRLLPREVNEYEAGLKATMVERRNPDQPDKPLMVSVAAKCIMHAGKTVNIMKMLGMPEGCQHTCGDVQPTAPQELLLDARWHSHSKEQARAAHDASVFGNLGVITVRPDKQGIKIPVMNALAVPSSFLAKYGATLIPVEQTFELEPAMHASLESLYVIEYLFHQQYVDEYVMKMNGGGGIFIETHPFPQIFTPLSPTCSGGVILGCKLNEAHYSFAAFKIPYGFSLKINSMVIHGDSFFVGPYAIALTETEFADTVLFRENTPSRDIQKIKEVSVPPVRDPLLAENKLATQANARLMIEKIRHDSKSEDFNIEFYASLPSQVLFAVRNVSPASQQAYQLRILNMK